MGESEEYEIAKFYRTSKYPLMMGRLPDGSKIFGGPYTAPQGIAGATMIIFVFSTWGSWANFGLFGNVIFAAVAVVVPVYLAGLIRTKNRNPIMIFLGALTALAAPALGKLADVPLKFRKPHRVNGAVITYGLEQLAALGPIQEPTPHESVSGPKEYHPRPAAIAGTEPRPRAVTALDRLMAQSTVQK